MISKVKAIIALVATLLILSFGAPALAFKNPTAAPTGAGAQFGPLTAGEVSGAKKIGINTYSFSDLLNIAGGIFQGLLIDAQTRTSLTTTQVNALAVSGRYAYLGLNTGFVSIVDISRINSDPPGAPEQISTLNLGSTVRKLAVAGRYLYVGVQSGSIYAIDVSNPGSPQVVSSLTVVPWSGQVRALAVSGKYLYVGATGDTLYVLDATALSSGPIAQASLATGLTMNNIHINGQTAYVVSESSTAINFRLVDIGDPQNPMVQGGLNIPGFKPRSVTVFDRYAYLAGQVTATNAGGLRIVDVKRRDLDSGLALVTGGSLDFGGASGVPFAASIAGAKRYMYLLFASAGQTDIQTVDVRTPTVPLVLDTPPFSILQGGSEIQLAGRYLIATFFDGLRVIDSSGTETVSASVSSLEAGSLQVRTDAFVGGQLQVRGSLTVGGNAIFYGNLGKAGGSFVIDHPLDPKNKILRHSFVESPERANLYDGIATLDKNGEAKIVLPDYFAALNRGSDNGFSYQLTPIGRPAPDLYLKEEIYGNSFWIAGGEAGTRVSWQVTGVRQDPWALAHPLVVEERIKE